MQKDWFESNGWCIVDYYYEKELTQDNWVDKETKFAAEFE